MAIKLKIPKSRKSGGKKVLPRDPVIRVALLAFITLAVLIGGTLSYFYVKYDRIIDEKFRGQIFSNSAKIYSIPPTVRVGEKMDARDVEAQLRRAGYSDHDTQAPMGSFHLISGGIEVKPGPDSYHSPEPARIVFQGGKIASITGNSGSLDAYELEPELITSLFDAGQRSKREVVTYDQIPKVMVDAVTAIEDRRFFEHSGVNFVRLAEAAWIDFTHQRHEQGGSTITMQLSRAFFLSPEKKVTRKMAEMVIAMELEQKFTKQQIFAFYANRVDLGQRGSFTISGFAEASHAYFNKNLKDITLPEAALIAGIIQAPSALSPYRHPERALERRNLVLDSMFETHAITKADAEKAKATPLKLAPPNVEASDAPYFVDLVRDTLVNKLNEREMNDQQYRIYTTLDPELQKAAAQAVEAGIKLVDDQITKMRTKKVKVGKGKVRDDGTARPAGAGRAGRDESAYRRSAGPGWRTKLRRQPTGSRGGKASYRIDLQAVCLCGRDEYGDQRRQSSVYASVAGHRCADDIRIRRPDLRTAELQRGVSRRRHGPLRARPVAEQCDGETCGRSGL